MDRFLEIEPKHRLLENVKERLIDEAIDSTYEHAGEIATYGVKISRQEVKNKIEELNLEQDFYEEKKKRNR